MPFGGESWICRRKKKLQTTLDTYVKLKPGASFLSYDNNRPQFPLKEEQNGALPRSKRIARAKSPSRVSTFAKIDSGKSERSSFEKNINLSDSGFDSNVSAKSFTDTPTSRHSVFVLPDKRLPKEVLKLVFDQVVDKTPESMSTPSSHCIIYVKETPVITMKPRLCVDKAVSVPDPEETVGTERFTEKIHSDPPQDQCSAAYMDAEKSQRFSLNHFELANDLLKTDNLAIKAKLETTIDLTDSEPVERIVDQALNVEKFDETSLPTKSINGLSTPLKNKEFRRQSFLVCNEEHEPISPTLAPKFSINDSIFNESYNCFKKTSEKPRFEYKSEAVRKKDERKKLCGYACNCCKAYFDALDLTPDEKERRICAVSRHRDIQAPPATPDHFWEVGFPSTADLVERRQKDRNQKDSEYDALPKMPINKLYTRKRLS